MRRWLGLALLSGCMGNSLPLGWSDDWLQFRGPTGQGILESANLPLRWSENENVVWYTPIPGLGWSSPVIQNDRIYLTTAVGDDRAPRSLRAVSLDAKSGAILWDREVFLQSPKSPAIHQKNSHASPTPILEGNSLFVSFGHEGAACLDLDGNLQWTNRDFAYEPTHGNGSSPILVDGRLILTCDGSENPMTLALDAATGKAIWQTPRGKETDRKFSFCTPTLIETSSGPQIISAGSDLVQALDPATGKVRWSLSYSGFSLTTRPLYVDGKVLVATGFMRPSLLAIDPNGTGDVTQTHLRWEHKGSVPNTPSLITYRDQVVMVSDNGIASGVRITDGKEIWKKRLGGNYSASPMRVGDRVYFQSEEGDTIIMQWDAGEEQPHEIGRNSLPGRTFASYAVNGNDLLIRNELGLYRIGNGDVK